MRLTRQTNLAIRVLMYCAANAGRRSRVPEVARAYAVTDMFMFKIIQPLVEHGLLRTLRGRNGGIELARPASQITLLDVVRATEESFAMAECFEDENANCPLIDGCSLNSALRDALGAFFATLDKYTIDQLVRTRPGIQTLLGIDKVSDRASIPR